jgi:hypothetical protein
MIGFISLGLFFKLKQRMKIISPYIYPGIRRTDLPAGYHSSQNLLLVTQEIILDSIEEVFRLNYEQIASPNRSSHYVTARIFYCRLVRKYLNWSLQEIGASINRDHTTIIHSLRKFEIFISAEDVFKELNKTIEDAITNRRCPIVYKIGTSRYEKYYRQILEVS